jgi:RNA-splicing ligase RtcB
MLVNGMIFLDDELLIFSVPTRVSGRWKCACLPGIVGASMAMPDIIGAMAFLSEGLRL